MATRKGWKKRKSRVSKHIAKSMAKAASKRKEY